MMKKGDTATVFHAGTNSYYEAKIIRPVSRQEMLAVIKASCGEDSRPDSTIFKDAFARVMKMRPDVYNNLNKGKTRRRLKAAYVYPTKEELKKLEAEMKRQFGDRMIKCGITREVMKPEPACWINDSSGEFFVQLTAY